MAKTNGTHKKEGPLLAAAFFCERTIVDKEDNAVSAIRLIDTLTIQLHPLTPIDVPSEEKRVPVSTGGLIVFKTGRSQGEHNVKLVVESPSGKKSGTVFDQTVKFTPEPQGGFNLRFGAVIEVMKGGLFWIHVLLDGKRVTKMPLMIQIERAELPQGTSGRPGNPALFS